MWACSITRGSDVSFGGTCMPEDDLDPATQQRYVALCKRIRDRSLHARRDYPPATEEQLQATETAIGHPLPLFLRMLYKRVANGGIGPYGGIFGAAGGASPPYYGDPMLRPVVGVHLSESNWRINDRVEAALIRFPGTYIQTEVMPNGFLYLADSGGGTGVELDLWTGRIYFTDCGEDVQALEIKQYGTMSEETFGCLSTISYKAASVEELFERWLDDRYWDVPRWAVPLTSEMLAPTVTRDIPSLAPYKWLHWGDRQSLEMWEDAEPHTDFDALTDSDDWRWYQTQPPSCE